MMPRSKTTPSKIARVAARDVPNSNQTWKNVERITFNVKRYFEWTGSTSTMKRYYYAGSTRVAMRTGSSTLNYLLGDHLGSQSITTNSSEEPPPPAELDLRNLPRPPKIMGTGCKNRIQGRSKALYALGEERQEGGASGSNRGGALAEYILVRRETDKPADYSLFKKSFEFVGF